STAFGIAAFVGIGTSQSGAHGRRRMLVVCAAMLIAAIVLVSCGTPGASLSGTGNANSSVTPGVRTGDAKALVPGTTITPSRPVRGPRSPYAGITVQGTSGNLSHSTQILVTLN
ncbi:MAG: hypothetical protein ACXVZX_03550, partial [Terriglobales bacterium]